MQLRRRWNPMGRCFNATSVLLLDILLTLIVEWSKADVVSHCQMDIPATALVKLFKNKCYHFISEEKYWTNADKTCAQYGGRLAKNSDEEINNFLTSTLNEITSWRNNGVWIGLHDRNEERKWEWTTGKKGVHEPVGWTNWAEGHPQTLFHSKRDCVQMRRSGGKWLWVDTPCETLRWHYRFICEYDALTAEADGFHAPVHVNESMVYFAVFGAVAVLFCVTGTAGGLIVYKIFCAKRRRTHLRNGLERSRDEATLQRAPLNTYIKLDEVIAQKRLQEATRNSEDDVDTGSAIYEEVPLYPTVNIREITYQNQNVSADYMPMNRQGSSNEIVAQERESENPYLEPGFNPITSSNAPVFTYDITPLNSRHRVNDVTYEEIGLDQQAQSCQEDQYPPAQASSSLRGEVYYNVSSHRNVSRHGGIERHLYESMDNVKTT